MYLSKYILIIKYDEKVFVFNIILKFLRFISTVIKDMIQTLYLKLRHESESFEVITIDKYRFVWWNIDKN